jgi:EmrB/QacA subfamily drug resistance transporter
MTATQRWTLVAAVVGSAVVFLDTSVVNVALPTIGQQLPRTFLGVLEGQTYVYNAYLLSLSALLVLAGALNDFYGRRRMFLLGLVGFGATSVLCGLAPTLEALVAFRLLQGAAAAVLVPGSLSLLTAAFSGEQRGRAIGIWAGASSAVFVVGPYVGGLVIQLLSWPVIFFLSVPIVTFAAWATVTGVTESRDEAASGRFDWRGAVVMILAVGGLSFGAIYGQQRDWQAPLAFVALGAGAVAAIAFPLLMARTRDPLVPLELFRSRNFSVTNLATLFIYAALYLSAYYVPLFTQGALGYSPAAAGAAAVPSSLFLLLFSSVAGTLAARYGPRRFMVVGPLLMAAGLLWIARIPAESPPLRLDAAGGLEWLALAGLGLVVGRLAVGRRPIPRAVLASLAAILGVVGLAGALASPGTAGYARDLLPGQILYGAGAALMVAPLTTALMASVTVARSGLASAINNALSRVGPQLAGAVIFIAITAVFYASLVSLAPALGGDQAALHATFPPLNRPLGNPSPDLVQAAREASAQAFRVAMLLAAALLLGGSLTNAVGIRDPGRA